MLTDVVHRFNNTDSNSKNIMLMISLKNGEKIGFSKNNDYLKPFNELYVKYFKKEGYYYIQAINDSGYMEEVYIKEKEIVRFTLGINKEG